MRAALSGGVHLTQDEAQVAGVHTHASASCLLSLSTHHTHQVGRQKTVTKRRRKTVAQSVVYSVVSEWFGAAFSLEI